MIESLPLVVSLFYITAGYMLVSGITTASVMIVARTVKSQVSYGALAVLSLSAAGYQIATALYYQAATETVAVEALKWQMDFASVGLMCACLFVAFDRTERRRPYLTLVGAMALTGVLIAFNRASEHSLHFASSGPFVAFKHPYLKGLRYLDGSPGMATRMWYGVLAVVLFWGLGVANQRWRAGNTARALFIAFYIVLFLVALLGCLMIDWRIREGIYPLGFAFMTFVVLLSIVLVMESARRAQQLSLRDKQMRAEVSDRRRAEGKLQRLSQVFMQEPSAIHIAGLDGKTLLVNQESIRLLRCDVSEAPKVDFLQVLEALNIDRTEVLDKLNAGESCEYGPTFFAAGSPVEGLFFVKDSWIIFKLYPIFDEQRVLREFVIRLEDVTERQFVESAINTISNAVSADTGQSFFTQMAVCLARLLNKKHVLIGLTKKHTGGVHMETLAYTLEADPQPNFAMEASDGPVEMILSQGTYAIAQRATHEFSQAKLPDIESCVGAALVNEHKEPIGVLIVLDDKPMEGTDKLKDVINIFAARASAELQRTQAEKTIRKMAFEDRLTGLPNRTHLNQYVASLLKKGKLNCAFIQVDLDHFKTINDALGHNIGDRVIRAMGKRLKQAAGKSAYVARMGGDEFALVIHSLGDKPECTIANRARQLLSVMDSPVKVGDHLLEVGCTLGVVQFPAHASTSVDVFRNADIALHRAKSSGRGTYQMFTPEMREEVSQRVSIEKGLREALANDQFSLVYQPQVSHDGKLLGAEVLLRWQHPEQGFISPAVFIPIAEETGLINPIGEWILKVALETRKKWSSLGVPFTGHLSINVSAWQLARPDFVKSTLAAVAAAGVPPSFITLEVTETAVLADVKDTIHKLAELRRHGLTIALDDFGTGYSSLAYLRDLPLDILKIDKAFIDVLETTEQEPLVESMISIGRHMGLQVVAEGVETQVQLQRLQHLGCNSYQGYLFSRPLDEAAFTQWLRDYERGAGQTTWRAQG